MQITIKAEGLKELQAKLKDFKNQLNPTIATALTRTAVQVREKLKGEMPSIFDRPTPFTTRKLLYVAATAKRPVAVVGFDVVAIEDERGNVMRYQNLGPGETPAGKYMRDQIDGGPRRDKRFEKALRAVGVLPAGWFAVPGQRAKMDAYGNQSIGELKQILSWFDAAELVAGSRQNMRQKGRDKRIQGGRKKIGFEYFAVGPGGSRSFVRGSGKTGAHKMQPGIYRRDLHALGAHINPIVIFINKARYKKRFDFYGIAEREGDRLLSMELQRAVDERIAKINA